METKAKRKLDPSVIRVGDIVKVLKPILFIRCGYPMSLQDARKEVEEIYSGKIKSLIRSVQTGENPTVEEKPTIRNLNYVDKWKGDCSFKDIVNVLAYLRLRYKNFGGNERKIYESEHKDVEGRTFRVDKIFYRKTGIYMRGYSGYDYNGEWDYCPSYLEKEKTHKILCLSRLALAEMKVDDMEYSDTECIPIAFTSLVYPFSFAIKAENVVKMECRNEQKIA